MKLTNNQKWMLFAALFSVLLIFTFTNPNKKIIHLQKEKTEITPLLDSTLLFQKKVIPNRIHHFISFLQSKNIRVQNDYELLLLLSNPITRKRIANDFHLGSNFLLLHAELADLLQTGMTGLDAQILHFSQRNYQNPFTGATINRHLLADADAESILEDMGGWMAGNDDPIITNYQLSLEEIEMWNTKEKDNKWNSFAEMP